MHAHALRSCGSIIRLLPCSPPGPPDIDGRVIEHKCCALGHWNEEVQAHLFSFADVQVTSRNSQVASTLSTIGSWEHDGAITDMQVADLGNNNEVLIAIASSKGSLVLGRLLLPRAPGTELDEVQILDLPTEKDKPQLIPALYLHKGAVASVDVQAESKALLTVGADGAIFVSHPEVQAYMSNAHSSICFRRSPPSGCASYTCGRWADTNTFATASALGGLQVWDVRVGPTPIASSSLQWGPTGAVPAQPRPAFLAPGLAPEHAMPSKPSCSGPPQCHTIAVHPSRPNMCASGGSGGHVALWDLRFAAAPAALTVSASGADVWEVHFDPLQRSASHPAADVSSPALPSVLCCSDDGAVSHCTFASTSSSSSSANPGLHDHATAGAHSSMWGLDHADFAKFPSFPAPKSTPSLAPGKSGTHRPLFTRPFSVNSMDVESSQGMDVVAVTEGQEVVYFRR